MRLTKGADWLEETVEETWVYHAFPNEHWRRIRTNNPLERIMREIRRRTRVVGAFPDGQAALKPGRGQGETHRWHQMVQQALHEQGPAQAAGQGCLMEQPAKPNVRKILDTTSGRRARPRGAPPSH